MDQTKLYQTQISFTEWFEKIQHTRTKSMREEDNEKRERLKILNSIIQLPFDKPTQFLAKEVVEKSARFEDFLKNHGNELCALRLIPITPDQPKLRMRGHTVRGALEWFMQQDINPHNYKADFLPHAAQTIWSTIFIVNSQGIFGEIIKGDHYQLTQGFYDHYKPTPFSYDFQTRRLNIELEDAKKHLQDVIARIFVPDSDNKKTLQELLNATFAHDYLCGYFETVFTETHGLHFCDYNRILGEMYKDFRVAAPTLQKATLTGMSASPGKAQGIVRIIKSSDLETAQFKQNEILVCDITTADFVPLMQRAAAIVTDRGGILSHAAIVSRELGIPCVTATSQATSTLSDGDFVEVDAEKGIVRKIEQANIEVEIRSFISPEKYQELLAFFHTEGQFLHEDHQETHYFDAEQDLRIQRNNTHAKIWLKKGKLHDEHREEIEIKFDKDNFETLEKLFLTLGYNTNIKWFRKRHTFEWQGITVMLDYTKCYGYIIELEKMSSEEEKEQALSLLKEKLRRLNIPLTSKEEFDAKYKYYKENWQRLVKE